MLRSLEFGFVSSSFFFHFVWFRLSSRPTSDHYNQSLTFGLNFGVRLNYKDFKEFQKVIDQYLNGFRGHLKPDLKTLLALNFKFFSNHKL